MRACTNTLRVGSLLLTLASCGASRTAPPVAAAPESVCSGARAVALDEPSRAGAAFDKLAQQTTAALTFRCPSGSACRLPVDRSLSVSAHFDVDYACELASCQVPYAVASLPPEPGSSDPCPLVLWSRATLALTTEGGTVALTGSESVRDVNVLVNRAGEGYLRFVVESPASVQRWLSLEQPNVVLLDVQLEFTGGALRGQMSALAAPLPPEPAADLRFTALWTATWGQAAVEGSAPQ